MIKAEAVVLGIDEREKSFAARGPLSRIDFELEDRELHTLAVIDDRRVRYAADVACRLAK